MAAHGDALVPVRAHGRGDRRRRRRGARVGRQPRVHRAAPAPGPRRRTSITPTSCAWTSIPGRACRGSDVRRVALEVKALLEELGLRGWPKTSGSRGMHVNVRIEPRWTFTEVRRAALALAREIERRAPDAGDLEVVEGGAARRLPRLQPEREGPDDVLGLLGASAARRARVGAAHAGTRCRRAIRRTSRC